MLDLIDVFVALVTILILRFGIPLGVTALLIWGLRWLDARWQVEAEQMRRESSAPALPFPPCWEIRQCSPERQATCPVYGRTDMPCWQIMREVKGRLPEPCLDCEVFRNAPVPQPA